MQLRDFLNLSVSYTLLCAYTFFWILSFVQSKAPDVHLTCIYSEDCVLPCSFPSTDDKVVIQWYQQEKLIYSYEEDEDEPDDSHISLFNDEVSKGNASLRLKDSRIRSKGRYTCTVNTTNMVQESFVIVKVEAPIKRISIEVSTPGHVQCSSHGVYPAPVLIWSTEPRISNLQPVTRMNADSSGLYSVESTLNIPKSGPLTYICTITPKYSSQSWKAILSQRETTEKVGQELVLPCVAPKNLKNFTLTWTFTNRNKNTAILTYHSQTQKIMNNWKDLAELQPHKVQMGDGSLYLDDLDGSKHFGKYTCTFSGPQVTYTVQTSVSSSRASPQTGEGESKLWVLAVVVAVVVLLVVLCCVYRKYKGKSKHSNQDTEMQDVHKGKTAEELPAENIPLSENTKVNS